MASVLPGLSIATGPQRRCRCAVENHDHISVLYDLPCIISFAARLCAEFPEDRAESRADSKQTARSNHEQFLPVRNRSQITENRERAKKSANLAKACEYYLVRLVRIPRQSGARDRELREVGLPIQPLERKAG